MKYIDSEKLIAEIERLIGLKESRVANKRLNELLSFTTSLQQEQPNKSFCEENCKGYRDTGGKCFFGFNCSAKKAQEQPEVDLEKEIHRFFEESIKVYNVPLYGKVKERVITVDCYEIIAYHFYKLGQLTKYQQDREEFAKLKAKEWQSGYDEGYAKGLNARKEK